MGMTPDTRGAVPTTACQASALRLPSATVVVCTYGRPEMLERALHSLCSQEPGPTEVLVVDNSDDPTYTAELLTECFPDVRLEHEPRRGLNFARNRALHAARGEVVLFLDDDAVAAPGWSGAIRAVFAGDARVGVCTGRVEALRLDGQGQKLFEANGGFSRGMQRIRLPDGAACELHGRRAPLIAWAVSVGSGNSFALRRDVALSLGGFDPALDMGRFLPGGGDHDMLWRILCSGQRVVYEPAALAWHEHRAELHAAFDQILGHQRALVAMLVKSLFISRGHRLPVLSFLIWRLTKPAVRLLRRIAGRDPLPAPVLLRMWGHAWLGLVAYPRARREAARRASEATHERSLCQS